jgi:hypothetical protein
MQQRDHHFMYYMKSLLRQLQIMFPECITTAVLSEKLAADSTDSGCRDLVEKWQEYMGTPETREAIRAKDVVTVLENKNPIMSLLQIKAKYNDSRLSEKSRGVLWQFIEKLDTLAAPELAITAEIKLPPPPQSLAPEFSIPPEMSPLIEMAKSFIQKIPEDDLDQMYSSIATISQNVMKNYEGQVPPELGGDYFANVLRQTFRS